METDAVLTMLQEVAAEVITPRFRKLAEGEVMEKNPGDLVTVADHESEELITRRLQEAYPDALILGEEATSAHPHLMGEIRSTDHWFTVDPVDGTKNFVHGSPDYAVMVGEVRDNQAVRGWIWQPEHQRAFVAERGAGAYADGARIAPLVAPSAREAHGVTSIRSRVGQSLGSLAPLDLSWVCCGVDYPQLTLGGVDYILYGRTNPWDHVPGSLLVTEVGGHAGHTDGTVYTPQDTQGPLIVAASRGLFEELHTLA